MSKCPICGKNKNNKQEMIDHVETNHLNEIPENMSTAQYIYYKIHGRDYGLCRVCNKPTPWNEKAGKPSQICGSAECKAKIKETAQKRMLKIYGKTSLMNDMKHQEKMLANRKISGTYLWSDKKHKFVYTGTYEKFAIEWLDKVMELNPDKIQMPGPVIPYEFNGEIKYWITDIYLEDFNLIIEIKAGKDENTHPGFEHNRELEAAKDATMLKQNEFNYVKITHKSMMNLIKVLAEIRMNNIVVEEKNIIPIISINESVTVDGSNSKCTEVLSIVNDIHELTNNNNYSYELDYPNEIFKINYNEWSNISEILNKFEFNCVYKPRSSSPTNAAYLLNKPNYKITCIANYKLKQLIFNIYYKQNINESIMYNSNLNNKNIKLLCEDINNEYTMSIANLNPIITNPNKNSKMSLCDRLREVKERVEKKIKNESNVPDPQDNMFSPNNTKDAPDPLVASNNFEETNEEIRVDMETDPYNTKPNDFAELSQSNIKSYFN